MERWNYSATHEACPLCGSAAEVRGIQDLVDALGRTHEAFLQQYRHDQQRIAKRAAGRFRGALSGSRARPSGQDSSAPAIIESEYESEYRQRRQEEVAIGERHPDLRTCLRDQVAFLAGGTRTVPVDEVTSNFTLTGVEAVVAALRAGQLGAGKSMPWAFRSVMPVGRVGAGPPCYAPGGVHLEGEPRRR